MQAIIFCGLQASGKSTFYKEQFFHSHVRISLDLFNTRLKELRFLESCLALQQRFVVDNTNPTKRERQLYIMHAKEKKFKIIGYFFNAPVMECIARNELRTGKAKVPVLGIWSTNKRMEVPSIAEGFDELYVVEIGDNGFQHKTLETV